MHPIAYDRGNAVTMKNMLESSFPGIDVVLANYPPPLPKRLLSKMVPVVQFGMIGIVMGGEQIFPRLGFVAPPPWFYSLRANRFGTISSTWLLGNFLQSFLQNTGAFEVSINGEQVQYSSLLMVHVEEKQIYKHNLNLPAFSCLIILSSVGVVCS